MSAPALVVLAGGGGDDDGSGPASYERTRRIYAVGGVQCFTPAEIDDNCNVLQWGLVAVEHDYDDYDDAPWPESGSVGYLDDVTTESEEDDEGKEGGVDGGCVEYGVIYFDVPFCTAYRDDVPMSWVRPATSEETVLWVKKIHEPERVERLWREYMELIEEQRRGGLPCVLPEPQTYVRAAHKRPAHVALASETTDNHKARAQCAGGYDDLGVLYCVRLAPEIPLRIKLGFSVKVGQRLKAYRTTNPMLELLGTWPCHRRDETAAIDAVTKKSGARKIGKEVFDVTDIQAILTLLGEHFSTSDKKRA